MFEGRKRRRKIREDVEKKDAPWTDVDEEA